MLGMNDAAMIRYAGCQFLVPQFLGLDFFGSQQHGLVLPIDTQGLPLTCSYIVLGYGTTKARSSINRIH